MKIDILNGPNLNLQGKREPDLYGTETFEHLLRRLQERHLDAEISYYQSNHEGALIDRLHAAERNGVDAIVLNAGAYAHTSIALLDAIRAIPVPVIEVHLSNIFAREAYRQHSLLSAACQGVVVGMGMEGYELAVHFLTDRIKAQQR